jgi:Flp pilus assembly pilin Flp
MEQTGAGLGAMRGTKAMTLLTTLWTEQQGQDVIEYALLTAFVALAASAVFFGAGGSLKGIFSQTATNLASANTTAS